MTRRHESHLIRVPILEDAEFVGLERYDDGSHALLFRSDSSAGHIQVWVHSEGEITFEYAIWDDRLGGAKATYMGPHGDPHRDQIFPPDGD